MDKLKMHSPDGVAAQIERLAELFPGCVTETRDEHGTLKRGIDFDLLRQELSDHLVEGPQERYRLDWPGKREALLAANAPIAKTLRPCREESVDFDSTQNLFIEGDNLEALKLLQETYLGKVKMIYIDPPYNTGRDFIYDDDFAERSDDYKLRANEKDDSGARLVANTEANGRFHSDWLSMMYSRLHLARRLLAEDGVICISIDDHEQANLRSVCDEVFGVENFVATIVWQKRYVSNVTARWLSDMHDFIHVYSRNKENVSVAHWNRTEEQLAAYRNPDSDPRGLWRAQDLSASKPYSAGLFEIVGPTGLKFNPPPTRYWRCNQTQFNKWVSEDRIWWGVNGDARPMLKSFLSESERGITPHTWWSHEFAGHNKEATLELKSLFDGEAPFDTPKPVRLMHRMLELFCKDGDLVLDFFCGSGTLAHGAFDFQAARGERLRTIVVQLPERVSIPGFETISDIAKERIRRAGRLVVQNAGVLSGKLDTGFRVLKIDTSNMADVYYRPDQLQQSDLLGMIDNIRPDRSAEDLLFQVLLDWGVDLGLPIHCETIAGREVYFVDGNALAACFVANGSVDEDFVRELARRQPVRAVFRDRGFANDNARINAEQIFKALSPTTEVRTL
jgi:adenine-specific DNA-methyltransferase